MTADRNSLAVCLLLATLPVGSPALAYVRTTNEQGTPISWQESCIFLSPDAAGYPEVGPENTLEAVTAAVNTWNEAAAACQASITFQLEDPQEGLHAGFNPKGKNKNVIVWLSNHWGNEETDYDPQALALTTLTFVSDAGDKQDGRILDADIEFNGVVHRFTTDPSRDNDAYDIQNDLTHELGHVLGLDHTCYDGWFAQRPSDDQGRPIPDCNPASKLPVEVKEATMYPYSDPDEITKRTLEQDDERGVCGIYPPDRNAGPCQPVDLSRDGCGCRTGGQPDAVLWLALLALSLAGGARRHRRGDHESRRHRTETSPRQ